MKYKLLSDYCRWDKYKKAIKLLKEHDDLDLTMENGICFRFAIKHNNIEILNALLDYYTKNKLQAGDHDSMAYKVASYELRSILQNAVNAFEVSTEMQKMLDPYIATTDDEHEQDLSEFDDNDAITALDTDHSSTNNSSGSDEDSHSANNTKLTADLLYQLDHSSAASTNYIHFSPLSGTITEDTSKPDLLGNSVFEEHDL